MSGFDRKVVSVGWPLKNIRFATQEEVTDTCYLTQVLQELHDELTRACRPTCYEEVEI